MDIKEKISIFEASCNRLLAKESSEMNKQIDSDIEKQISDELEEYQNKEAFAYNKKLEKMEKDFNKEIYALQMEAKKDVLTEKKNIQKDIKKEVVQILKDFTNTDDYKEFLFARIDESVQKLENINNSTLKLVQKDIEKYSKEIEKKYDLNIQIIDDQYIGGCILEDKVLGVYIDNSIQNSINENME